MAKRDVLTAFLAIVLCGCNGSETHAPVPAGPYLPSTTIDNAVTNLRTAIRRSDIGPYSDVLADSFEFVFAPQDVGGPLGIPPTWGRTDEIVAMSRLFADSTNAEGYTRSDTTLFTFTVGMPDTTAIPGLTKVVLSDVYVQVSTRQRTTGDPLWYLVQGDQAWLYFQRVGPNWKLARWDDKPILGVDHFIKFATVGRIKALWWAS